MGKYKIKNNLGMFDLLRGVTMFFVVFVHTYSLFPVTVLYEHTYAQMPMDDLFIVVRLLIALYGCFVVPLMPAFFIMSGYGYRKTSMGKTLSQQSRMLLMPYAITSVLTVFLHLCTHYSFYHYFKGAVKESLRLAGGFALGLPCTAYYGDLKIFSCGPIWYLLALMWAWCIFNSIMLYCKEKYRLVAVVGVSLFGWLISLGNTIPFCISQGLIAVLYLYIGYYVKNKKIFINGINRNQWIIYIVLVIVPNCVLRFFGIMDGMADSIYSLGFFSIIEDGLMGVFIIFCFLKMNCFNGKISSAIRFVGRNSMMVFCVHTFEMMGFPWYYFANAWMERDGKASVGCLILYLTRLCADAILCLLLFYAKRLFSKMRKHANGNG